MYGKLIGVLGPAGVGKNYVIKHIMDYPGIPTDYLPRMTTRAKRPTDDAEGVIAVSHDEFAYYQNNLLAVHAPFNDDRYYGWYMAGAGEKMQQGINLLTDPNVDYLDDFCQTFGDSQRLIGLAAQPDYIKYNLEHRILDSGRLIDQSDKIDIKTRIEKGRDYTARMRKAYKRGQINEIIDVDWSNRHILTEIVIDRLKHLGIRDESDMYNEGSLNRFNNPFSRK